MRVHNSSKCCTSKAFYLIPPQRMLLLTLLLFGANLACQKTYDPQYTALMRYQVTDFRLVGIDARPVDPHQPLPLQGEQQILLTALVLQASPDPVELEWLDCPSYDYGYGQAQGNVNCISSPRELRLGRGLQATYDFKPPDLGGPRDPPAPGPVPVPVPTDAGFESYDADPGDLAMPDPVEADDGLIYLRATQNDRERFARKSFFGLYNPALIVPRLVSLRVDGQPRAQDEQQPLIVHAGQKVQVEFAIVGLDEAVPVQWFVSGGSLNQRGLTLYDKVETLNENNQLKNICTTHNDWTVPMTTGPQQLMAVVGGQFGPVAWMRLRVEVSL